ncbi:glycosyltransferase [Candidatus Pacearchaeota archaeon]|nr:glycosyltransferase [Candidatus Pacearchaeota archaeon]
MPVKKLLIIVPVYNEEKTLGTTIPRLVELFNKNSFPEIDVQIAIAGRQSTDRTNSLAEELAKKYQSVIFSELDFPSKCGRIAKINLQTEYDFYAFIDADLPIEPEKFSEIIRPVVTNEADLSMGSRYAPGASQNRSFSRVFVSKSYNLFWRLLLPKIKTTDLQVGAKAWNKKVAKEIIPKIQTTTYSFDAELLYFCFDQNLKVKEIPVHYSDTRKDSKISILHESWEMGTEMLKFALGRWFS